VPTRADGAPSTHRKNLVLLGLTLTRVLRARTSADKSAEVSGRNTPRGGLPAAGTLLAELLGWAPASRSPATSERKVKVMARVRIGELLMQKGSIDELQLQSALAHQSRWGGRLGRAVVHLGFLEEATLLEVLGEQLNTPFITIGDRPVAPAVLQTIPAKLIRGRKILPLAKLTESRRGPLVVALADPGDLGMLDEISFVTGLDVRPVLATEADLDQAIDRLVGTAGSPPGRHAPLDLPEDTSPLRLVRRTGREIFN
jgi:type IV pilus assembly protein PilB